MTQKQIFDLAVKMGIQADLRGEKAVKKYLLKQKEKFEKLPDKKKEKFDKERLDNPFMDSGIWVDDSKPIKKILAAIDITSGEIMMAKELGVDGIISHHPLGKGLAMLDEVMHLQAEVLATYGVPINIAESMLKVRISEVARGVHAVNHYKTVDAARLMKINLMSVHTPCDNLVASFLKREVEKEKPEYVGEAMDIIREIDEYKESAKLGVPVKLFAGSEDNRAGRIAFTEITGGTEGTKEIYGQMSTAGIGTIVAMHLSEDHRKNAEAAHLNVIVVPHIASDSLGMNLFLDELEKRGLEIIPCGGLFKVKRK